MFICLDCHKLFAKPRAYIEDGEPYDGCPACAAAGIRTAIACDICGDWIEDDYITLTSGETVCQDCYTTEYLDDLK